MKETKRNSGKKFRSRTLAVLLSAVLTTATFAGDYTMAHAEEVQNAGVQETGTTESVSEALETSAVTETASETETTAAETTAETTAAETTTAETTTMESADAVTAETVSTMDQAIDCQYDMGDVMIQIHADADVFPAGTVSDTPVAVALSGQTEQAVKQEAEGQNNPSAQTTASVAAAYDISFSKDGNEVEPYPGKTVDVQFTLKQNVADPANTINIVHVSDSNATDASLVAAKKADAGTIDVTATSFSVYAVVTVEKSKTAAVEIAGGESIDILSFIKRVVDGDATGLVENFVSSNTAVASISTNQNQNQMISIPETASGEADITGQYQTADGTQDVSLHVSVPVANPVKGLKLVDKTLKLGDGDAYQPLQYTTYADQDCTMEYKVRTIFHSCKTVSSDEGVVKIDDSTSALPYLNPQKAGTATVTMTFDGVTSSCRITVTGSKSVQTEKVTFYDTYSDSLKSETVTVNNGEKVSVPAAFQSYTQNQEFQSGDKTYQFQYWTTETPTAAGYTTTPVEFDFNTAISAETNLYAYMTEKAATTDPTKPTTTDPTTTDPTTTDPTTTDPTTTNPTTTDPTTTNPTTESATATPATAGTTTSSDSTGNTSGSAAVTAATASIPADQTGTVLGVKRGIEATLPTDGTAATGEVLGASRSPKTGDESKALLWMFLMAGSGAGAAAILLKKKSEKQNQ